MQAVFEVQEIIQPWKPPFEKKVSTQEFKIQESESFDSAPKVNGAIFKLLQISGNRALLEYHRDFTPKGYEQPSARQFWFGIGETREFSHLWGENGITKKVTLKGLDGTMVPSSSEPVEATQAAESMVPARPHSKIIEA